MSHDWFYRLLWILKYSVALLEILLPVCWYSCAWVLAYLEFFCCCFKFQMDLPTILPEYQLSFLEGSGNDDLFGNHFGSPGNPNRAFFHRLFGLRKFCEETFWDFLQDCSLITSSMKCDSCLKLLKYPLTIRVSSIWVGGGFAFFYFFF